MIGLAYKCSITATIARTVNTVASAYILPGDGNGALRETFVIKRTSIEREVHVSTERGWIGGHAQFN